MRSVRHVVVTPSPDEDVEELRDDLAAAGFTAEVHDATDGMYVVEDRSLRQHLRGLRNGLALGAVLGVLLGVVVVMAVPMLRGASSVVQVLAVGGIALQVTMPVMMWRMTSIASLDDDPVRQRHLEPDDLLLVVDAPRHQNRARAVLDRHDVTFLADDEPMRQPA